MVTKIGLALGLASLLICPVVCGACGGGDDSSGAGPGGGGAGTDGGGALADGGGPSGNDGGSTETDGGTASDSGTPIGTAPTLPPDAGSACTIFPADNPWNTDVSDTTKFPTDPHSDNYIAFIQGSGTKNVHPDFGSDPSYGIPYIVVPGTTPKIAVTFDVADESDPGPYPIPLTTPLESGSDSHAIAIDKDACKLYELDAAHVKGSGWQAYSGALFDLKTNALRTDGFTSADAAGLPIFAGLARLYEVKAGAIHHALRVTIAKSAHKFVHPATHSAGGSTDPYAPPMGMRLRLKAGYDTSALKGSALVIATALKHYGLLVADNSGGGNNWFISGETNTGWNDDELDLLKAVPGTAFEVVTVGTTIAGD
ncbi:MAG: hypothetical protein ABI551_10765 [Polyangiaceae bacterium]